MTYHFRYGILRVRNTIDRIEVLNKILGTTETELIAKEIVDELNDLNNKVKHLLQEDIRLELSINNLLKSARKVIEEEEMDICPLCEQKIDRKRLLTKIDDRLKILRDLSEKSSEVRIMSIPVINKLNGIVDEFKITISKIESFSELAEEKSKIIEKITFLNEFVSHITSAKDLKNEIPVQEFNQQKNEINGIWSSLSTKCGQLLDVIGLTEAEKKVLGVARLIEQARSKATELSRVRTELKMCRNHSDLSEKIYWQKSNCYLQ